MSIDWEFDLHLGDINDAVKAVLPAAALKAMEVVRVKVAEQTPVETGQLVGSETVRPTGDGAEIFIPGPYARNQHYNLTFHHNHGNAYYLARPMVSEAENALEVIRDEIGKVL